MDVVGKHLDKRQATVSFFGVPCYITYSDLSNKLDDFGVRRLVMANSQLTLDATRINRDHFEE